jgi:dolichol-phosphate mannosyltransferase
MPNHAVITHLRQAPWDYYRSCVYIVLPAFNEAENIPPLLKKIDIAMHLDETSFKVIVVDDGSKDNTAAICKDFAAYLPLHLVQHPVNKGLGITIRDGLAEAARLAKPEDIVVVMDADNSHPPGLIHSMLRKIKEGNDVVIASRYQSGGRQIGVSLLRRFLSRGASILFRIVFPTPGVRDYTCGYRAYRAAVLQAAIAEYGEKFVDQEGFQCMIDIILKLRRKNFIFAETPLVLRYDQKEGASKMKVLRTIMNTLKLIVQRRFVG